MIIKKHKSHFVVKICVVAFLMLTISCCKKLSVNFRHEETRHFFKRDLHSIENLTSLNQQSSNATFCKNPTLNEFPQDFLPFKNSSSYWSKFISCLL